MERRILIIDDDPDVLAGLGALLTEIGWEVSMSGTAMGGLRLWDETSPDVVLVDVMLPDRSGIEVLEQIKSISESTPVILMSGVGTIDVAVQAMRLGAESFLPKPCDVDNLELVLEQAARSVAMRREIDALRRTRQGEQHFLGVSAEMKAIANTIARVANAPSPVLIEGESGTGKGVVARVLHASSNRARAPYVELNCAGLSRELLESELFGHERGAFTGAVTAKEGLLEVAAGGTVFLDEIGELEPAIQARLLKVVEEKRFRRVGGVRDLNVNIRLVAATNRVLDEEVAAGRFRRDLLYRLNVVRITIPPLRERRDDILPLAELLLQRLSTELGTSGLSLSRRAAQLLRDYSWPGNVRELRNVIERAILLAGGKELQVEDLLLHVAPAAAERATREEPIIPLERMIEAYIRRVVESTGGNIRKAARLLGVAPSTIYARLKNDERNDGPAA
jgi:DNA-binding NtrC family response regulator